MYIYICICIYIYIYTAPLYTFCIITFDTAFTILYVFMILKLNVTFPFNIFQFFLTPVCKCLKMFWMSTTLILQYSHP